MHRRAGLIAAAALALAGCSAGSSGGTADLDAVAAGDPAAIDRAVARLPGADAPAAERIQRALARAMQAAPDRVLPLVNRSDKLRASAVCVPFLPEDDSPMALKEIVAKSRYAIESVDDPALARQKTACLAEIAAAETELARNGE